MTSVARNSHLTNKPKADDFLFHQVVLATFTQYPGISRSRVTGIISYSAYDFIPLASTV